MMRCECGFQIDQAHYPVYCRCGRVHTGSEVIEPDGQVRPSGHCVHFGHFHAEMECGCGKAHRCTLLDKLCSLSQPIDDCVFAGDVRLTADAFQWCGNCEHQQTYPAAEAG